MASVTPMSFFTPDASINPDEYTFEIADAKARKFTNVGVLTTPFDMNDITEPGMYKAAMAADSITNWPHPNGYLFFSVHGPEGGTNLDRLQIIYGGKTTAAVGKACYSRYTVNGAWVPWSLIAPQFGVKAFQKQVTVPANTVASFTIDVSIAGYDPVAISGFTSGHGSVFVQHLTFAGTTVHAVLRNITSGSLTITPTFSFLYMSTGYAPTLT